MNTLPEPRIVLIYYPYLRELMELSSLHRHSFGIKADVKDNVAYVNESRLVLPSGNNTVFHNTDSRDQIAIPGASESPSIPPVGLTHASRKVA